MYSLSHPFLIGNRKWQIPVRPHLSFFPKDTGKSVNEYSQAAHWRHEADPELLTLMVPIQNQQFFIFEPSLLRDHRVCMPVRWFIRDKKIFAQAWMMRVISCQDGSGWIVEERCQIEVSQDEFLVSFGAWDVSQSTNGLPHASCILGKISRTVWAFDPVTSLHRFSDNTTWTACTGLEQLLRQATAGECSRKVLASILSQYGSIATIHPATYRRNGTNTTHFFSPQLVSLVLIRTTNTMCISFALPTQHHRLKCWRASSNNLSLLIPRFATEKLTTAQICLGYRHLGVGLCTPRTCSRYHFRCCFAS